MVKREALLERTGGG